MIDGLSKTSAEEVVRHLGFILGLNVRIGWDEEDEDDFETWYEVVRKETLKLKLKDMKTNGPKSISSPRDGEGSGSASSN